MSNNEINIRVEEYQFIDNLTHIIPPKVVFEEAELTDLLKKVEKSFLDSGWEGDGEIGIIWIPPFVNTRSSDTYGEYVWHVKQDNNGISFLGYMEFKDIDTESLVFNKTPEMESITITKSLSIGLKKEISDIKSLLDELERVNKERTISSLYLVTLDALQNKIISGLIDYIDEVYLQFAEHVLGQNNPDGLKLTKAKINLPLDRISAGVDDGYIDSWLILKDITNALWKDFKFWSFRNKFKEICKCVEFACSDNIKQMILKHVEIRNSIQHHNGEFINDMAKSLGQQSILIIDCKKKEKKINVWEKIELSYYEVEELLNVISNFVDSYEKHIESRMNTRIKADLRI